MLRAKLDDLPHWSLVPVCEISSNNWGLIESWHEIFISSNFVILRLEVLFNDRIFDLAQLPYSGRPDEKCENVLSTEPALIFFVSYNLPLAHPRNHRFVSNVS